MALNPLRDAARRRSAETILPANPLRDHAEAALAAFRSRRDDLQRQVHRGDMTPKTARQHAAEAAEVLREELVARCRPGSSNLPPLFQRLVQAAETRKLARTGQSIETLQLETNRLLRQTLVEQQLSNRLVEFQGRTFVRPITGGQPAPTLDSLLTYHLEADRAGDEAAREWARRQLEGLRPLLLDPEDHRKIDTACDRPDRVNPRMVARYVEILRDAPPEEMETFLAEALECRDAGACCTAYLLAREAHAGSDARWVRTVLERLKDFPDSAIDHLRAWEGEVAREDFESARAIADHAVKTAEVEAKLPGLELPAPDVVERHARIAVRPVAQFGQPIGLAIDRRGLNHEEFAALQRVEDPDANQV